MQPAADEETQFQNSITTTSSMDQILHHQHLHQLIHHGDDHKISNHQNILNITDDQPPDDHPDHQDVDTADNNIDAAGEYNLDYEPDPYYCMDNNPPESYSVCESKVADWLDRNTFMERKASVKFACSKNLDPCQTRASRRSVSLNQKPKLAIIGFRKKPIHHQTSTADGRSKHNNDRVENVRLFRNRSEPGRDYCLLITEPVSPRVSCVGRVGSMRVQGRKQAGVWRSFKAAFSNLVQTNRSVTKTIAA